MFLILSGSKLHSLHQTQLKDDKSPLRRRPNSVSTAVFRYFHSFRACDNLCKQTAHHPFILSKAQEADMSNIDFSFLWSKTHIKNLFLANPDFHAGCFWQQQPTLVPIPHTTGLTGGLVSLLLLHHLGWEFKQDEAFGLCGTFINWLICHLQPQPWLHPVAEASGTDLLVHKHPSCSCCPALSASQPWMLPCSFRCSVWSSSGPAASQTRSSLTSFWSSQRPT